MHIRCGIYQNRPILQPHALRTYGGPTFGQQAGTPGEPPPDSLADLDFDSDAEPLYNPIEASLNPLERNKYRAIYGFLLTAAQSNDQTFMENLESDEGKLAFLFEFLFGRGTYSQFPPGQSTSSQLQTNQQNFDGAVISIRTLLLAFPDDIATIIAANPAQATQVCSGIFNTLKESDRVFKSYLHIFQGIFPDDEDD